jgi:predicted dehydrogenase/threonine dehydrogenase-like Zn-dependent dehydrogenase
MKQVIQDVRTGETSVFEVPTPKPKPGTVLVRTAASLVSAGTERALLEFASRGLLGKARSRPDLVHQVLEKVRREGILTTIEAVQRQLDQPMPLGYSSSGWVVEVGDGVTGFQVGDRVVCAGGGYAVHAEYAVVPKNMLSHLPESVDFESGASATLGAIALHGFRLAEAQIGERVAVIGLGLLGILTAGIARAAGCVVFGVDLSMARVELARTVGIEATVRGDAEKAAATFSKGMGFDVVLICADTTSDDPVELGGAIARDRARVVAIGAVGTTIPRRLYYAKELTFLVSRSYGPGRYDPLYEEAGQDYPFGYVRWTEGRNLAAYANLLAEGKLDVLPLITHRFPIERATEAYEVITGKSDEPFLGVLITYPESSPEPAAPLSRLSFKEQPIEPTATVRLGALGAGNFAASVLFPALRRVRDIELVGLATATGMTGAHTGQKYGFRYATTDEKEILSDERINTVAVLTRHHLHARQVIDSLQAGKHVFCEKPLCLNKEDLIEIAKAVDGSDGLLTVGFNRRFAPLSVQLKTFLEGVHEPMSMHYRVNAGPLPLEHWLHDPGQGGGRIVGEACHFIDFLTFLLGAPPICVQSKGLPDDGRYQEDNVLLTFEFPDGSVGTITYLAAGDRAFPKERLEVIGGGRVAVLDDFRRLETSAHGRHRVQRSWLRQDKGHRAIWQAFVNAIMTGGLPPIPYDQLFAVSMASFAAVESLRSGEAVTLKQLTPE